jgi:ATP-binding cassette, subfamily B, bacterial HlyB/CyaB
MSNALEAAKPMAVVDNCLPKEVQASSAWAPHDPLPALCLIARLHHIAAEPEALRHQLGKTPSESVGIDDLLLAAKHLGLKAKRSTSSADRLNLIPLPALALMTDGRCVVLAQCDGQRVLVQDASAQPGTSGSRPTIEPLDVFTSQWTRELVLVTSRASLAGELAKFDFSWFVPALIKHRKLFGEVLLISLFLQLFALVSPLFFQAVMDKVLTHRGVSTLDVLVIGLLVVVIFESVLNALRTYVFSHTTSRIDVELGAKLFRHLLALPLA